MAIYVKREAAVRASPPGAIIIGIAVSGRCAKAHPMIAEKTPVIRPQKTRHLAGFLASGAELSEYRGVSGLRVGLVDRLDVDGDAAVLRVVLRGGVLFAVTLDDEALRVDALLREVLRDGLGAAL